MAIRITGMYSGLDTESIINELASAQSYKKTKLVKAQKRLSWKQDSWKALNTKLYSFYQKLDDLRMQGSYRKKKTVSSNPNAVSVISDMDTADGVQTISVTKLASSGYLTGGELKTAEGGKVSSNTTLEKLGITDAGSVSVNTASGFKKIDVTKDMTVSQFVDQLKNAGVNARFDEKNQRIFVNSKESGEDANFTLMGDNTNGVNALAKLGLLSEKDLDSETTKTWADYMTDASDPTTRTQAYKDVIDKEIARRAAAYKAENDKLTAQNESLTKKNEEIKKAYEEAYGENTFPADADLATETATLKEKLYGHDEEQTVDGETKKVHIEGELEKNVNDAKKALETAQEELKQLKAAETPDNDAIAAKEQEVADKSQALSEAQSEFNKERGKYSYLNATETNKKTIADNETRIADNATKFKVDADNKVQADDNGVLRAEVETELDAKVAEAKNAASHKGQATGKKIDGEDAKITLNDVEYTSATNSFEVGGMTISVMETTDKPVTLSTSEDVDGVYDMIKGLFTEYNKLVNEMDAMYNADAAKGYDPLTSEEKDALSDDEIEEWEKKVKDSLLRRDSSLNTVASAMKQVMLQGAEVDGKTMYLSDFGINTLGYFGAADNERNAYHIDGDKEDSTVSSKENVLQSMIATDPDTVMNFFSKLANNMHDEMQKKMAAVKDTSSAMTFYNDKLLKKEYDSYTEKIKKQEDKINALMDKWYSKFSKMETAMSKLESKNNSLSSMLGG